MSGHQIAVGMDVDKAGAENHPPAVYGFKGLRLRSGKENRSILYGHVLPPSRRACPIDHFRMLYQ